MEPRKALAPLKTPVGRRKRLPHIDAQGFTIKWRRRFRLRTDFFTASHAHGRGSVTLVRDRGASVSDFQIGNRLLAGQNFGGRNPRGAMRRHQARRDRDEADDAYRASQDYGLNSGHMKQNSPHGFAGEPCCQRSQYGTRGQQAQSERDKLAAYLSRLRTQCHAHADFAAALGYGVAQHAIGAHRRSGAGRSAEKMPASNAGERLATRLSAMRVSMERRSFTGSSGSICRTSFLHHRLQRFRRKAAARDHEEVVVGAQGIRIVDRALGRFVGESGLFHRAHHADDGECFGIFSLLPDPPNSRWPRALESGQ